MNPNCDKALRLKAMALLQQFEQLVAELPSDWTDLEFDLRLTDQSRYVDASIYLVVCNAQPYSNHSWHWRVRVANNFGHAASVDAVRTAFKLLDQSDIDGEIALAQLRNGRAPITPMWGRPDSARRQFDQQFSQ